MAVAEQTTVYPAPGSPGSPVSLKPRYENFIGGHWVPPVGGAYSADPSPATGTAAIGSRRPKAPTVANPSPATGQPFCEVARSTAA